MNRSTHWRVAQRVRHQIAEDLAHAHRVDLDRLHAGRRIDGDAHPPRARVAGKGRGDVARELAGVDRLFLQLQRAALRQGERSEILDEPRQHVRLLEQHLQLRLVARIDTVQQAFELSLDDGERRPQLVRDVGHEIAPQPIVLLKPLGHRVERVRPGANRRRTMLGDANVVRAGGHAIGRFHHTVQRRDDPPHHGQKSEADDRDAHHAADEQNDRRALPGGRDQPEPRRCHPHERDGAADAERQHDQNGHRDATEESAASGAPSVTRVARRPRLVLRPPWWSTPAPKRGHQTLHHRGHGGHGAKGVKSKNILSPGPQCPPWWRGSWRISPRTCSPRRAPSGCSVDFADRARASGARS